MVFYGIVWWYGIVWYGMVWHGTVSVVWIAIIIVIDVLNTGVFFAETIDAVPDSLHVT